MNNLFSTHLGIIIESNKNWNANINTLELNSESLENGHLIPFYQSVGLPKTVEQEKVIVRGLTKAPTILPYYYQAINLQFEPKLVFRWLQNVSLMEKLSGIPPPPIIDIQPPFFTIDFLVCNIVPPVLNKNHLSDCLEDKILSKKKTRIPFLSLQVVNLFICVFKKLKITFKQIDQMSSHKSAIVSQWKSWKEQFSKKITDSIPTIDSFINALFSNIGKGENLIFERSIKFFTLLQSTMPQLLEARRMFNPVNLVENIKDKNKLVQFSVLKFLSENNATNWCEQQQKFPIKHILKLLVSTENKEIYDKSVKFVVNALKKTEFFGKREYEIDAYLKFLFHAHSELDQSTYEMIIGYFVQVIKESTVNYYECIQISQEIVNATEMICRKSKNFNISSITEVKSPLSPFGICSLIHVRRFHLTKVQEMYLTKVFFEILQFQEFKLPFAITLDFFVNESAFIKKCWPNLKLDIKIDYNLSPSTRHLKVLNWTIWNSLIPIYPNISSFLPKCDYINDEKAENECKIFFIFLFF